MMMLSKLLRFFALVVLLMVAVQLSGAQDGEPECAATGECTNPEAAAEEEVHAGEPASHEAPQEAETVTAEEQVHEAQVEEGKPVEQVEAETVPEPEQPEVVQAADEQVQQEPEPVQEESQPDEVPNAAEETVASEEAPAEEEMAQKVAEDVQEAVAAEEPPKEEVAEKVAEVVEETVVKEEVAKPEEAGEEASETSDETAAEDPACPSREHIIRCVSAFLDEDGNGKLEKEELNKAIGNLPWYSRGVLTLLGTVNSMMKKCDVNGDDAIGMVDDMEQNKETCLDTCSKRKSFKRSFFPECDL